MSGIERGLRLFKAQVSSVVLGLKLLNSGPSEPMVESDLMNRGAFINFELGF